jgi:hypothetical protein
MYCIWEFSGTVDGKWEIGEHHWIRHKNRHLFISKYSSQFNKGIFLSRIYLPGDNRIFSWVQWLFTFAWCFDQIGDQIVINHDYWLKFGQFAKVFPLLEIKVERRIQCPNRRKWHFVALIFKIFPGACSPTPWGGSRLRCSKHLAWPSYLGWLCHCVEWVCNLIIS